MFILRGTDSPAMVSTLSQRTPSSMAKEGTPYLWCKSAPGPPYIDCHVAFRGHITVPAGVSAVHIDHVCISWYNLFVDGDRTAEGPTRFMGDTPYFDRTALTHLGAGTHVIAIHAHSAGVQTRFLLKRYPVMYCKASVVDSSGNEQPVDIEWKCTALQDKKGYKSQWQRLSTLIGWAECAQVEKEWLQWTSPSFDDSHWESPVAVSTLISKLKAPTALFNVTGPATSRLFDSPALVGSGVLWERYGYADDEPAARFYLRKLQSQTESSEAVGDCASYPSDDYGPPQGQWWRFDAGKVQLLRPLLTLSGAWPAGTVVEIGYSQELLEPEGPTGRVAPFVSLCGSRSSFVDRYTVGATAAGTTFELCPHQPRGARYVEVHVLSPVNPTAVATPAGASAGADALESTAASAPSLACALLLRCYGPYQEGCVGAFSCSGHPALDTIWRVGVETTRSCVEDSCIDGPCRERGQWTGDTLAVTLQVAAAAYCDVRPLRLALLQTAAGANADGVISGNCPEVCYPLDYALLWYAGAVEYHEITGDTATLSTLLKDAYTCMNFLMLPKNTTPEGLQVPAGCSTVIDWGYVSTKGTFPCDLAVNCLYVIGLDAMIRWCTICNEPASEIAKFRAQKAAIVKLLRGYMKIPTPSGQVADDEHDEDWVLVGGGGEYGQADSQAAHASDFDWSTAGYHAAALALTAKLFSSDDGAASGGYDAATYDSREACVVFVQAHVASCFPLNPKGPRLATPSTRSASGFFTPYFSTFALRGMIEEGAIATTTGTGTGLGWAVRQYEVAWGWALTQANTWVEVFDPRWEKVHSWGGCPTWQLSRYGLGLTPRSDVGARYYDLRLRLGTAPSSEGEKEGSAQVAPGLADCSGKVPCFDGFGDVVQVQWVWQSSTDDVSYTLIVAPGSPVIYVSGWGASASTAEWVELPAGSHTCTLTNFR